MHVCCDAATVERVRGFLAKTDALGLTPEQLRGLSGLFPAAAPPDSAPGDVRRELLAAIQQGQTAPLPTGGTPAPQAKSPLVADAERRAREAG